MHEVGHLIGLIDLSHRSYPASIMARAGDKTSIPSFDVDYAKQVYRDHASDPH